MALRQLGIASFENESVIAFVEYDDASSPARATRFYCENNGSSTLRIAAKRVGDADYTNFDFAPGDQTSRNLPSGANRIDISWASKDAQGVPVKPRFSNIDVSVLYPYFGD